MATATRTYLRDLEGLNEAGRPARRRSLQSILSCLAIGQILREEYVYEVHGPFVAEDTAPTQPPLAAWMIARLTAAGRRGRG